MTINGGSSGLCKYKYSKFKNNTRSYTAGAYYFGTMVKHQDTFTFRTSAGMLAFYASTGPSVTSADNISFPSEKGIDFY